MQVYFFFVALLFLAAALVLLVDSLLGERVEFRVLAQALVNLWAMAQAFGIAYEGPLRIDAGLWGAFLMVLAVDLLHAARFFVMDCDHDGGQPQGG